jgi:hypothetical protein
MPGLDRNQEIFGHGSLRYTRVRMKIGMEYVSHGGTKLEFRFDGSLPLLYHEQEWRVSLRRQLFRVKDH